MSERLQTRKYIFTVEGQTEQMYLYWLREEINKCPDRTFNVSFNVKIQQSPAKFYKSTTVKISPEVTHICDIESNEPYHVEKFQRILSEMKEAKTLKNISYSLGYSNYTFELWLILHKRECSGFLVHRKHYLDPINQAFNEKFETLDHFKHEDNLRRCLSTLNLDDVKMAIRRAERIAKKNSNDGTKTFIQYKGYSYCKDNPSLSVHEIVKKILEECGVM